MQHFDVGGVESVTYPVNPRFGTARREYFVYLLHHVVNEVLELVKFWLFFLLAWQPFAFILHIENITAYCETDCNNWEHTFGPVSFLFVRDVHSRDHMGPSFLLPYKFVNIYLLRFVYMIFQPQTFNNIVVYIFVIWSFEFKLWLFVSIHCKHTHALVTHLVFVIRDYALQPFKCCFIRLSAIHIDEQIRVTWVIIIGYFLFKHFF